MDRDLDRQEYETWDRVLTNVVPHDHIVQLYQDEWCRHPERMLGRDFVTGDEDSSNHRR